MNKERGDVDNLAEGTLGAWVVESCAMDSVINSIII